MSITIQFDSYIFYSLVCELASRQGRDTERDILAKSVDLIFVFSKFFCVACNVDSLCGWSDTFLPAFQQKSYYVNQQPIYRR